MGPYAQVAYNNVHVRRKRVDTRERESREYNIIGGGLLGRFLRSSALSYNKDAFYLHSPP